MFKSNKIIAYPTNTSYGLGVRADDLETLIKLNNLKKRSSGKFFSLMMKNFEMLKKFAEVPTSISQEFFFEKPRTILLKPKATLPKSPFWPKEKVGFRVCTLPEVVKYIEFPITATSANESGEPPIFSEEEIKKIWGKSVECFPYTKKLPQTPPSEIWDYTTIPPKRIR